MNEVSQSHNGDCLYCSYEKAVENGQAIRDLLYKEGSETRENLRKWLSGIFPMDWLK